MSEPHIHYKSLLTGVYDHAGCKEYCKDFTVALTIFDVFNKKQMHDSVIKGKEIAYKNLNCILSMFLMSFNIYFVYGFACAQAYEAGGRGGASASPGLKIFRANSVFRASTICSKIPNDKRYFNTVKNSRATLFSRQAQVAQKS